MMVDYVLLGATELTSILFHWYGESSADFSSATLAFSEIVRC